MKLSHQEKLSLLHELIRLAGADGEHRDEEFDMLMEVTRQLGVAPVETQKLFEESVAFTPPKEEARRIVAFYLMLKMVWADAVLNPEEEALLSELGVKLGFRLAAVQRVIANSKRYARGAMPVKELIEIFQINHN